MASQKAAVLKSVILKAAWKTHVGFNYKYFWGTTLTLKANAHWTQLFWHILKEPFTGQHLVPGCLSCHCFNVTFSKSLILQTTKIWCRSTVAENTALGITDSSQEFRIKLVLNTTKTVINMFLLWQLTGTVSLRYQLPNVCNSKRESIKVIIIIWFFHTGILEFTR